MDTPAACGTSRRLTGRIGRVLVGLALVSLPATAGGSRPDATTGGSPIPATTSQTSLSSSPGSGFQVVDNTIVDGSGQPFVVHGIGRPSLEWACSGQAVTGTAGIPATDFAMMAGDWKANSVRLPLNQDYWLSALGVTVAGQNRCLNYVKTVKQAVASAEAAGLAVILDLHWSDSGDAQSSNVGQKCMTDRNSLAFWRSVAQTFGSDLRVMFELYNEPHDVPWPIWRDGGSFTCTDGVTFTAVGMQQLVDAVRAANAQNVVLAGGTDWGYDLSGVRNYPLHGTNIAYATHPYLSKAGDDAAGWDRAFGDLAAAAPVVATEFGRDSCDAAPYDRKVLDYFRDRGIGYSGWAWWAGSCGFPSLIADSSGRCAEGGCTTQADLAAYSAGTQRPSIQRFSPLALCPACAYDFEDGTTQGWQVRWGQSLSVTPTTSPAYSGTHALALSVRGAGYPGVGSRRLPAGAVTGASVTYHVWAPVGVSAGVAPYLLDGAWAARLAPATQLRPGWTTVGLVLPAGTRATELGLQVNSTGWAGQLVLDAVEVSPPAPPARYDFENESTQGWQVRWGTTLTAVTATAPTYRGSGSLTLTVSGAGNPAIGTRDLLTGLGAGTVVTFHLWAPAGATVSVTPYVFDGGWTIHQPSAETLQPGWNTISFALPATAGLSELGLQVNSGGWRGPLALDAITVQPTPALT